MDFNIWRNKMKNVKVENKEVKITAAEQKKIDAAIALLEKHNYTVKKKSNVNMKRIHIEINGVTYPTLSAALRANEFNTDDDWLKVRALLKKNGGICKYKDVEFKEV